MSVNGELTGGHTGDSPTARVERPSSLLYRNIGTITYQVILLTFLNIFEFFNNFLIFLNLELYI